MNEIWRNAIFRMKDRIPKRGVLVTVIWIFRRRAKYKRCGVFTYENGQLLEVSSGFQ